MAGVRSPIINDAAGSIGGAAFQRGASGLILRAKRRPANPQTPRQIAQRAETAFLASQWPSLEESDRLSWNALAEDKTGRTRFGDRLKYSGMNLFMKANANARLVGATTVINSPVNVEAVVPPTISGALANETDMTLTLSSALPTGWRLAVFASKPFSVGRKSAPTNFIQSFTTLGTGNIANLYTGYINKYGSIPSSGKVSFMAELINPTSGDRLIVGKTTVMIG